MQPPSRPPTRLPRHAKLPLVTAIAELEENRTVEGIYAVARKERLRTRNGSTYLALELVDPSGRIGARVWNDVDLLEGRFETGDAVRVLGRVEGFLEFLVGEVHDDALRVVVTRALADAPLRSYPATPDGHHSYAGGLLEHTFG